MRSYKDYIINLKRIKKSKQKRNHMQEEKSEKIVILNYY